MNLDLTAHDIRNMSDEQFLGVVLVLGPFSEPDEGEKYLRADDWHRLTSCIGDDGAGNGVTHEIARRVSAMRYGEKYVPGEDCPSVRYRMLRS